MNNHKDTHYDAIEWSDHDKTNLDEIKNHVKNCVVGESLRCISHSVSAYLNKALLSVQGLQMGEYKTPQKQKQALKKIFQNILKASATSKEVKNFYHL